MSAHLHQSSESRIKVGQVYASTHSSDIEIGSRQRRRVINVQLGADSFVWLQTEDSAVNSPPSRVRLRSPKARTIPGHKLVEDVPEGGER